MKRIYHLLLVSAIMVGCTQKETQAPKADPVFDAPQITLFKQSLPVEQEVLKRAYKKIRPAIGLANMSDLKGKSFNGEFVFDAESLPFIEYKFDKPYIIKKIHLKSSGFVVDGDASSSHIKKFEILFLDETKTPIYLGELKEGAESFADFDNVQADGFIIKTHSVYTNRDDMINEEDVVAAFDGRVEVEVIDTDYVYDIVKPVLSERESSSNNEELLQTIALLNTELFKRLREQRKDFHLPKTSVLYLPDDADMHYAIAHTEEIFKTGKYKTVDGEYKIHIFHEEAEFDAKSKVRVKQHKIEIQDSKRNIKTTTTLPEHEEFIDFSEGL